MEINVHDDRKIVEIWLTNAEKRDTDLRERLKPLYREYKEKKYLVAVFESGDGDLYENTSALLLSNRRKLAEKEVREEQQRMQMMM